jgi:hypothetical protein
MQVSGQFHAPAGLLYLKKIVSSGLLDTRLDKMDVRDLILLPKRRIRMVIFTS